MEAISGQQHTQAWQSSGKPISTGQGLDQTEEPSVHLRTRLQGSNN